MNDLHEMAANSREAAWTLAASSLETRNAALPVSYTHLTLPTILRV